jgi:predicted acyl esterase
VRIAAPLAALALVVVAALRSGPRAVADDPAPAPAPAAAYAEPQSVEVPTRDDKRLAASLWLPAGGGTFPVVVVQTPYGQERFRPETVVDGADYAYLVVDWRGFHGSEAAKRAGMDRRRGEDGYDVVEWAAKQPWCTGKVGTWGTSALGIQQYRTAEQQPPHLACEVPVVAGIASRYAMFYPGGVYRKERGEMMDRLGFGVTTLIESHPLEDAVWKFAESAAQPARIDVPTLLVGGWFDLSPEQTLEDFATLRASGGEHARATHRVVMGPWTHHVLGGYPVDCGEMESPETKAWLRGEVRRWLDRWLRGGAGPAGAPVTAWRLGEGAWKTYPSWPPPGVTTRALHLGPDGTLSEQPPPAPPGFDSFAHDPTNPVPTVGGCNLDPGMSAGSHDQRRGVIGRQDVLVYRTAPLEQPLTIAGRVRARFRVTCEGPDAQVHVRLCDEDADGKALLLGDAARLLSLRTSTSGADPVLPGTAYEVEVVLSDLLATFAKGHRVLIAVSGSNVPRYAALGKPATVRVARGGEDGSRILLPVLP